MISWNPSVNEPEHAGAGRYTLTANADGGLVIQGGGGWRYAFRLLPGDGGGRTLIREGDGERPVAFWTPAQEGLAAISGGTVLLADGDLFQVLDRPGPVPGYDLVGWQGGGPYLSTQPEVGPEQIRVHAAGRALLEEDRGRAVLAMFVAVTAGYPVAPEER